MIPPYRHLQVLTAFNDFYRKQTSSFFVMPATWFLLSHPKNLTALWFNFLPGDNQKTSFHIPPDQINPLISIACAILCQTSNTIDSNDTGVNLSLWRRRQGSRTPKGSKFTQL
jgi:hypothetical protein